MCELNVSTFTPRLSALSWIQPKIEDLGVDTPKYPELLLNLIIKLGCTKQNHLKKTYTTETQTRDSTLESLGFSRFVTMTIGKNRDQEYKAITCLQIQTGVYIYMISKRVEYSPAKLQCLHLQYLACHVGSDVLGVVVPG